MNKFSGSLLLLFLVACGGADRTTESVPDPITTLQGVHDEIEGVDVWTDSVPAVEFEIVRSDVDLALGGPGAPTAFPATRIRAAADSARAAGADAAIIRTTYTGDHASGEVGNYEYEIDLIRYLE